MDENEQVVPDFSSCVCPLQVTSVAFGTARHGNQVDAVPVALPVWYVVSLFTYVSNKANLLDSTVSWISGHADNTQKIILPGGCRPRSQPRHPSGSAHCPTQPVEGITKYLFILMNKGIDRDSELTSSSRKLGQPWFKDSFLKSSNVLPRGAIKSGFPVTES